ncbi:hypothetical protein ACFQNF_05745 [Iodobacter arcticus]|uniref:Uncharacterized protein n=1 Tax=Iodobacter arcticus TaxID=590593 RepID=A0ABW2QV99_9NEIS
MRDLDEATRAELADKVELLVVGGMDRLFARRQVWNDYQAELVAIAASVEGIDERPPPDLPPPREKGKSYQPKSWYIPRPDSGQNFFTPERMQKSRSELEKLKQRMGVKS